MDQTPESSIPVLPRGTLTFLFTDLEGSTRLWDLFPEQMRSVMARHDVLIESTVKQNGGMIVRPRGEGDSRFAVFSRASNAVLAATAIQRQIHAEAWPLPAPIRIRVALHTGEADLRDGDYYGSAVNRCARLRSIAHGGQTILSQATFNLVQELLPGGVRLRDLGTHNLRDLNRSEHIYQIVTADLPSDFPPLKTASTFHTNLPIAMNSFIGRKNEIVEISRLLANTRLLTITGPGGAGKTRLVLQLASDLIDLYKDGVWLVDLAPLSSPSLLVQHINKVLGLHEADSFSPIQVLAEYLADKDMLLILDNCEHLLPSVAPLVETLLSSAARLRILATSRESLGAVGETAWPLPPLSSPRLKGPASVDRLLQFEAVKLFIDRAMAVRPDFTVTEKNSGALAQICSRLDGNPLAIELAAARVKVLSVEEIAERLDDRFHLLVGSPTASPRQQTLQALIDWSYELLSTDERILLRRLSVFAGGWSLAAAEEVCSGGSIASTMVLDLLSHLVDKSLVVTETNEGERRFRFLETILQYSQDQLAESQESEECTCKYAEYYLKLAEQSYGSLWGPRQGYWLGKLETEHDNLRAVLEWFSNTAGHEEHFLRMAGSLWRFWEIRGYLSEGRAWLESALAKNRGATAYCRANALRGAGNLARLQGDYEQAKALHEQSLALFQEIGNQLGIARELDALGEIDQYQGSYSSAMERHTESLSIRYEINDREGQAVSLGRIGVMARDHGQHQYSKDLLEESLKISRELQDRLLTAQALNDLGLVAYFLCEYKQANALFEEAVAHYRDLNDKTGISDTLQNLGNVAKDQGNFQTAKQLYGECMAVKQEIGDRRGIARVTANLSEVAFNQGEYFVAYRLSEQSYTLAKELGVKRTVATALLIWAFASHFQGDYERARSLTSEAMGISSEINAPRATAHVEELFGLGAYARGEMPEAREHFQRALEIFRKIEDPRSIARLWVDLARVSYRQRDPDSAVRFLDESLSISRKLNTRWNLGYVLEILGLIERSKGNTARALTLFQESLNFSIEQENKQGIANCLGALAGLALTDRQHARATRLFAAAEKLRWAMGAEMGQRDREEYEGYLNNLQDQMEAGAFRAAWSEGSSATLQAVIADLKEWSGSLPAHLQRDPISLLPPPYDSQMAPLDGFDHLPSLLVENAG